MGRGRDAREDGHHPGLVRGVVRSAPAVGCDVTATRVGSDHLRSARDRPDWVLGDARRESWCLFAIAQRNRAWGLALDFVGASSYVWRFKHNVHHHTYANIDGMDSDIDAGPFLRFAPSQRLYAFHRYQHLYAWPLYVVLAVKWWFIDDVVDLVRGRIGQLAFPRPRGRELVAVLAGKAAFLCWAVVVPVLVFRSGWVAPLFLLGAWTLGVVLSTVFQLAIRCPTPRSTPLLEARSGWRPAGRSTRCAPPWTLRPRIVRRSSSALMAITRSVV